MTQTFPSPHLGAEWSASPDTVIASKSDLTAAEVAALENPEHREKEWVILSSLSGGVTGITSKALVHTEHTPLHHAFSCYLRDEHGQVLVTRRSLEKIAWPGVWTNAFCGHPAVGETYAQAITRRAERELGIAPGGISNISTMVADFWYQAVDASGIVEYEVCPVFMATLKSRELLNPADDEVAEYTWVAPGDLVAAVDAASFAFSPWMVSQLGNQRLRQELLG